MKTNLLCKLLRKITPNNLKKLSGVPPKAPGSKALARWLTVRIAEIFNLANPRLNLANAWSPWALCGTVYIREKIFCEPELEENELPEEPKEHECEDGCPGCPSRCGKEPEEKNHD